jgi:hypothetical protein
MAVRHTSSASVARASSRRRCARPIISPTKSFRPPPISRSRWASRCCSKAHPGVGKTEAAKAIAGVLGRRSCCACNAIEGIDAAAALYEWNFPRQMLALRQAGEGTGHVDIYGDELPDRAADACLLARPNSRRCC